MQSRLSHELLQHDHDGNDSGASSGHSVVVAFEARSVWRASLVVLLVVALAAFGRFVLHDGGSVLYQVLMAWFAAIALAPAVNALAARGLHRSFATAIVMGGVAVFITVFLVAFGNLLVQQIAELIRQLPNLIQVTLDWINNRAGTHYAMADVLASVHLTSDQLSQYANQIVGGVFGLLTSTVGVFFSLFTFSLLTFYFSADNPRLRVWLASLLPGRGQQIFVSVWDLTTIKTGRYVAARALLAAINGGTSAAFFYAIGLPSWLALGLWTGLVAQFVPTIGTYISITLPVLVGLLSPHPWMGLAALGWAIVYQQVENIFVEPRISSRAVDVHPAVAFVSVMLGTALFGVGGALTAIPVSAALLALFEVYGRRFELVPELRLGSGSDPDVGSGSDVDGDAATPEPEPEKQL